MSLLFDHHIIQRQFWGHDAFRDMDSQMFDIDSPGNRIYLPADRELAADMDLSRHPSRHVAAYMTSVLGALNQIAKDDDPVVRAAEVKILVDAMRIGFANGDLHTNIPAGKTREDVDKGIAKVFADYKRYVEERPDQLQAIRDLEQKAAATGQNHLIQWSAILGNPARMRLLSEVIGANPDVNITAGNKNLAGTPWSSQFTAIDTIPYIHATPGTELVDPADFSLPGRTGPSLDSMIHTEGLTPINPLLTYGDPGFPVIDPTSQGLGQLPPTMATPQESLVLQFHPETSEILRFSDQSPVLGPAPPTLDRAALKAMVAGAGLVVLASPELWPTLPLWLRLGAAATILSTASSAAGTPSGADANSGAVFSAGSAPYNAFSFGQSPQDMSKGSSATLGVTSGPPLIGKLLEQDSNRVGNFVDSFGNWTETAAGAMPAQASGAIGAPAAGSTEVVAPESVRRLTRVSPSNSANVFATGSQAVPHLPSSEFNDRFGNWIVPSGSQQPSQASKPVGVFADEPGYSVPPPIWGLDDHGSSRKQADEWFSRWVQPFLRQD